MQKQQSVWKLHRPDPGYDCDGNCLTDTDGDSICDEFEIAGCTDSEADNYNSEATDDDGSVNTSLKDVQIHKLVTTIHLQTQMTLAVNLNLVRVVKLFSL